MLKKLGKSKSPSSPPAEEKDKKPSSAGSNSNSSNGSGSSMVIGQPTDFVHQVHVNEKFQWTGEDRPGKSFEVLEQLGAGSFGVVFKARHKQHGFVMAVKVIMGAASNKEDWSKLENEMDILKRCRDENIVSYFGCCLSGDDLWILTEYCSGGSIRDVIERKQSPLKEDQVQVICREVLSGLVYLYKLKIVHNDIKASNILLTEEGGVKIADFGVSEEVLSSLTGSQGVVGSPYWMAPEVIQHGKTNFASDIWSFGITTIEMADGYPPYANFSPRLAMQMIANAPSPKVGSMKRLSKGMREFLKCCLKKKPEERHTAESLLNHSFVKKQKNPASIIKKLLESVPPPKPKMQPAAGDLLTDAADADTVDSPGHSDDESSTAIVRESVEEGEASQAVRAQIGTMMMYRTFVSKSSNRSVATQTEPDERSVWSWLLCGCFSSSSKKDTPVYAVSAVVILVGVVVYRYLFP